MVIYKHQYIAITFLIFSFMFYASPNLAVAAGKTPHPPSQLRISVDESSPPGSPSPVGNDSLMSGMTPGNYNIPSGWTLVRSQDFEGGCRSDENCGGFNGGIVTERSHTGSRSVGGTYSADQGDVAWKLRHGVTGSFSEIYLSFYEYIEAQALFNDELYLARFSVWGMDPPNQEVLLDWYWAPGYNKPSATLYAVPQGEVEGRFAEKTANIPKGSWVQWEIWYRPNSVGSSNGFIRIYLNGTRYSSAENVELNGREMTNSEVQAGGVYTKLVWMTDYPTCTQCSSGPGQGTDYCTEEKGWFGTNFSNPVCGPSLPSFKRFIDDIIVIKKR